MSKVLAELVSSGGCTFFDLTYFGTYFYSLIETIYIYNFQPLLNLYDSTLWMNWGLKK